MRLGTSERPREAYIKRPNDRSTPATMNRAEFVKVASTPKISRGKRRLTSN
jgi:hypothetical protein